jgi:hypothetical protein
MATSFIFNRTNINGIPCIETTGITESATAVTYNFNPSPVVNPRFSGIIAVRVDEVPTNTALPVSFNVPSIAGTTIALSLIGGTQATGADLEEGIHLVFYDRFNGVLQLLV